MKKLCAFDLIFFVYLAILSGLVAVARPRGMWIYLLCHATAVGLVLGLVWAQDRFGGRFWTLLRYWYIVPVILVCYRELHYLVPAIHPFRDHLWDRRLAAIDQSCLGSVDAFFLSGWPGPLVDLLYLCYLFYFGGLAWMGVILSWKSDFDGLREYASVILTGMFLSYLGYLVIPAIGPHFFYAERPEQLNGWILGGPIHRMLLAAELEMPDAFPSGHALMSMIVLYMAWRHHRPTFWWILLPATGCVIATVALRYHYVVDVVASVALFPAALALGIGLDAWRERARTRGEPEGPGT